ncbi:acyl-CoA thioesterase [Balnearium lithotrophicum]|uniref:Acyl-CoA thioesterase n=1 Tax=Balnearium lithotrophicum TaxID=223788 RepID=A0A521AAG6_9BACT|nr:hydroxyphenylacetyl-CoA thioesterase PaaI [Balnearium lithotrophicum]SMO31798.1 acyl-CoA thioesterase [Balnearium lithotrophicum]
MSPREIASFMEKNDKIAKNFNMKVTHVEEGKATVEMVVSKEMLNAAGVCQGGAIFSLADFAFAVASNSYGNVALAVQANIYFLNPAFEGEKLTALAYEKERKKKTGLYCVEVKKEDGTLVALFTGQVVIKESKIVV